MCQPFDYFNTADRRSTLLARVPLFEGVELDVRNYIATKFTPRMLPARSDIVTVGESADRAHLIVYGIVEVMNTEQQENPYRFMAYRGPGAHLRTYGLVLDQRATYSARTLVECGVFEIRKADFVECYERSTRLTRNLLAYYVTLLKAEFAYRSAMLQSDKTGQIATTLLQIADALSTRLVSNESNPLRLSWLTQSELAQHLNVGRDAAVEAYKRMRSKKAIKGGYDRANHLEIVDVDILRKLSLDSLR